MLSRRIASSPPALVLDRRERLVRLARRVVVVELDVVELGPADDRLLLLGRQRGPAGHVVQVLLDDHVAAAGEVRVGVVADQRRVGQLGAGRVGRAVDEAEQVARVEVAEADRLVDHARRVADARRAAGARARRSCPRARRGCGRAGRPASTARRAPARGPRRTGAAPPAGAPATGDPTAPEPIPTTHDSRPPRSRKPTFLTRSPTAPSTSRMPASASSPSPAASTRNTAARDSGASTLCASIGTRSHAPCSMAPMFARPGSEGAGQSAGAAGSGRPRNASSATHAASCASGPSRRIAPPDGPSCTRAARLSCASLAPGTRRAARPCRPRSARRGRTGRPPPATPRADRAPTWARSPPAGPCSRPGRCLRRARGCSGARTRRGRGPAGAPCLARIGRSASATRHVRPR